MINTMNIVEFSLYSLINEIWNIGYVQSLRRFMYFYYIYFKIIILENDWYNLLDRLKTNLVFTCVSGL